MNIEDIFSFFRKPPPPPKAKPSFDSRMLRLERQLENHMQELDDLKAAVDNIAADNLALADEVRVAVDRMGQMNAGPKLEEIKKAVVEATQSLAASHAGLGSTLTGLKAKVDEVSASNGDAG